MFTEHMPGRHNVVANNEHEPDRSVNDGGIAAILGTTLSDDENLHKSFTLAKRPRVQNHQMEL